MSAFITTYNRSLGSDKNAIDDGYNQEKRKKEKIEILCFNNMKRSQLQRNGATELQENVLESKCLE